MQHLSENCWKPFFPFPRGKGKTGGMGKRENEIECREKGKGSAPDLKSEPRITSRRMPALRLDWAIPRLGDLGDPLRKHAVLHRGKMHLPNTSILKGNIESLLTIGHSFILSAQISFNVLLPAVIDDLC